MGQRKRFNKIVHFASTIWFVLCLGFVLILTLREAGVRWWTIFSLSGHSILLVFLLISLYLFAVFRVVDRGQQIEIEHPLTSTSYYAVFYDVIPFLGSLAGYLGMIGTNKFGEVLLGIVLGTLGMTFLVWIIIDPVICSIEKVLPSSRKHRAERLAHQKALREEHFAEQQRLLTEIEANAEQLRLRWDKQLQPYAKKFVALVVDRSQASENKEAKAVDIGLVVWQMGGLGCMRQLHAMMMEICEKKYQDSLVVDCISNWWDGIGTWRSLSLCQ